ncbi:MAG: alpha/beta fold hydrolase [Actinomycetota bacterium]
MSNVTVRSADGVTIAVERFGDGPPLVVVPGALSDLTAWMACAPLLANGRGAHVIDRRGRGTSGDATSYEPEREVEDVLTVLAAVSGPADLLGHSSGAILALWSAERAPEALRRLVLYEPPVFLDEEDQIPDDLPERLDALLATGDEEAAVQTFMREGPRAPEAEIQGLRRHPAWARMLAMARTVAYDARIQRGFDLDLPRLAGMRTPTMMLIGAESPPRMRKGSAAIAHALPDVRIEELPGQAHLAQLFAPDVLAGAVDRFLSAD